MEDITIGNDLLLSPIDFIGRQSQLNQLDNWHKSSVPIASILGPPGVGKTWLVKEWAARKYREEVPIHYIDAGYGTSASTDDPEENTEFLLQLISFKLGLHLSDEIERPIELASRVRQSGSILILDRLESCLHRQRQKTNVSVGRPAKFLANFLRSFVTLSQGAGRIIIVSNVCPADFIEAQYMELKYITTISSDEARDPLQLGGFTQEETFAFVRTKSQEIQELPSENQLLEACKRLGGHPKGLSFYLGLNPEDRQRFLINTDLNQALDASLRQLFTYSISYCTETEKSVLILVSLLRIPLNNDFISRALKDLPDTNASLDDLRHRSLIELGTTQQFGYSAHGIVREFVKAVFRERLTHTHLLIAEVLESIASQKLGERTFETLQLIIESAYHYKCAGEGDKALFWRNASTKLAIEIGKEAFLAGNHQLSRDTANALIEGDLTKSSASPYILSKMYFYRAQNQHQIEFNWKLESQDLLRALELNPLNKMALSYSAVIVTRAIQKRVAWDQIEISLKLFIEYARLAEIPNNCVNAVPIHLIRLLCILNNNTADKKVVINICDEFASIGNELNFILTDLSALSEAENLALLTLYHVLRKHATNPEIIREHLSRSLAISTASLSRNNSSSQIWLRHIETVSDLAEYSTKVDERKKYSKETLALLEEMKNHVSLTSGYARLLSEAVIRLSYVLERSSALLQIQDGLAMLSNLKNSASSIGISQEEMDAAQIRMSLRAARLEPEKYYEHIHDAVKIILPYLHVREKWLSFEVAEQAVYIISDFNEEDLDVEIGGEIMSKVNREILINKADIKALDEKLDDAQRIVPTSNFELLKLSLRVEYLRKNWQPNDPNEPAKVKEAEKLAEVILQTHTYSNYSLTIISDLYQVIATRTFSHERFVYAVNKVYQVLNFWLETPRLNQNKAMYRKAKFLRAILDYRQSRQFLNEYLKKEKLPHMRFFASRFLVDVVAHSINWEYIENPKSDRSLKKDAMTANKLFKEYLEYLGLEHEDIDNPKNAIRELFWIRIASFLEIYQSDLNWVKTIYEQLRITSSKKQGSNIYSAQIIGELPEYSDRIAQILGAHWEETQIWREVGTLLSILSSSEDSRLDYSAYFWRISTIISQVASNKEYIGHQSGQLSRLNMVRALLKYPTDSDLHKKGQELLNELYKEQKMPWVYWQFIDGLWKTSQIGGIMESSNTGLDKKRPRKYDVFISYSRVDKKWVIQLKSALEAYGIRVWLDSDEIRPGDQFIEELEKGIKKSRCIALVLSPEAVESVWVKEEYHSALSSHKLRLIPVLLRKAEIPGFLKTRHYIDFSHEEDFDDNVGKLVYGITGKKVNA
jgi:hypothetical protein